MNLIYVQKMVSANDIAFIIIFPDIFKINMVVIMIHSWPNLTITGIDEV